MTYSRLGTSLRDMSNLRYQTQKIGRVLYDFEARWDDELSIIAGETIVILDDENTQDWWLASKMTDTFQLGQRGQVPATYVEVIGTIDGNTIDLKPITHSGKLMRRLCIDERKDGRQTHFRFLDLPRELRDRIYTFVFDNHSFQNGKLDLEADKTSLLLTSKQLYSEATPFYYNTSQLDNRLQKSCLEWMIALQPVPRTFVKHMRHKLHTTTYYGIFAARRGFFQAIREVLETYNIHVSPSTLKIILEMKPNVVRVRKSGRYRRRSGWGRMYWLNGNTGQYYMRDEWKRCKGKGHCALDCCMTVKEYADKCRREQEQARWRFTRMLAAMEARLGNRAALGSDDEIDANHD